MEFSTIILSYIKRKAAGRSFDLVWIDGGAEIGPAVYRWFKQEELMIINYNVDDPFGYRDGRKWIYIYSQ